MEEKKLFEDYLELQSSEWKKDILSFERVDQSDHQLMIKVNFTWGFLRVYKNKENELEWY